MLSKMMVAGSNRRIHTVDRHAGMVSRKPARFHASRSLEQLSLEYFLCCAGHLRPSTRRSSAHQLGWRRGCKLDQVSAPAGILCELFPLRLLQVLSITFQLFVSQHIWGQDTGAGSR